MKTTYTITQAQQQLPAMVKESASLGMIPITRHHETVAYVVSKERMDSIVETLEILAQPETMHHIRAYERGELNFHSVDALNDDR
ncbi:MAG: type II toxin-antitoxin system Phd/YefM family antitoxin [Verrucomicrobia bacterium]|nr:type II toxin-antitoxin system Phd/YefM family antitoxin [Verrucomicrobiota bacterium]MCH8526676.1 type II toxin-antitoxin system Phd/YefM family antitoxin [Kiritimatiellia bacterium]